VKQDIELSRAEIATLQAVKDAGFRGLSIVRGYENQHQRRLNEQGLLHFEAASGGNWKITLTSRGEVALKEPGQP
jgi:hypothetical protein